METERVGKALTVRAEFQRVLVDAEFLSLLTFYAARHIIWNDSIGIRKPYKLYDII